MATLKVNTLTGTSTAGSIAVTGEGNSTTTNLQQGLTKAWHNFDGEGTIATRDSFNIASVTDNSTGDYRSGITNNFGNDDYSCQTTCSSQNGYIAGIEREAYNTTSQMSSYVMDHANGGVDDANIVCVEGIGDLA
tara:strand:- start:410 stop:814 length:405 start_codon:yes stop_codon:yes gene_type:complete